MNSDILTTKMKEIRKKSEHLTECNVGDSFILKNQNFDGKIITILTIILIGRGCFWARNNGGCSMCGFYNVTAPDCRLEKGQLYKQFQKELAKYKNIDNDILLLIYTSGSFLDVNEVSEIDLEKILRMVNSDERIKQVDLESLPRFINEKKLRNVKKFLPNTTLGISIGLESSNELIRKKIIHKDKFSNLELKKLARIIKKYAELKINIILKPPFLTEKEAIEDTINSFKFCEKIGADFVYIGACNIQPGTLSYYLWRRKMYNPPNLLSLLEVAKKIKPGNTEVVFGGFADYPEPLAVATSCDLCREKILNLLNNYDSGADFGINCVCKKKWAEEVAKHNKPLSRRIHEFDKLVRGLEIK